uniref:Calx-beta domain-containing protein n=1 Tax=Algoriphagus sp. TaxID=1872435 RepID=UPI0025862CD7
SNTVTMTVTSTLVPSVSIAANPGNEICTGTSVTFTATPVNGGDAPVYQWKLNGKNVGTNAPTYTNAALANGDQVSVMMTSSAACASPSAASSNTVTMTVTSTLVPSVSIAANPGNQICTGTSVTFTATPINGGDAPVYQWKLNGNNVGINSPTYTNAALANGDQVSVVMTSSAACASPTSTTSNTVTMTVTSTLVPSVSIAANPGNQICTGTSVTFTATPVNGGDAPVYQWKLNGNNVGTNAPTYTNAALANGDQMSVVMTSSAACASPSAVTSNTVTMTVTSTLVPSVSIAANPGNQICTGTSVTFTATPVNGGDAPVYQWKLNGNNVGINSPTYTNASLTNGDQVSVMMTSSAACASPSAATSNTVAIAISSLTTYYQDLDGDGYGNPAESIQSCTKPSGYVENNTDCNDYLAAINPGAIEICGNGIDENCNGMDDDVCSEVIPILRTRTYAIKEGDRGIIPAVLEVTLDSEATQEVSLNYTTVDGQARAGEDYVATSGVLIIPTGSRSGQISIGIIGDTRQESNERFAIQFSSPINVRLPENPISSVLILDDDKAPKVSVLLKQGELWKVKHVPGQIEELTIFTQNGFQLYQKNNLSNELQLPYFAPGSYFFAVRFQDEYGDYQLMQGVLIIKN